MGIFNKFINRYKKQNPDIQQDSLDNQNNTDSQDTVKAEKPNKNNEPNSKVPYIGIKKEVMVVGIILAVILFFIIYFASQINILSIFSGKPAKKLAVSKAVVSQNNANSSSIINLYKIKSNNKINKSFAGLTPNKNIKKPAFSKINGKIVPSIPVKNGFNPNAANSSGIVVISNSSSASSITKAVNPALALQESILKGMAHPNIPGGKKTPESINQKNKNFLKNRAKNQSIIALVSSYHSFKFKKPFVITPGTLIPATLETGVNSQLPGPITAIVNSNVYSHDLKYVLIPAGSTLIGQYSSAIGATQTRVLLAFTLIIYPNGKELQLPGFEGVSHRGYAGMQDIVDTHFWSMAKSVGLLTLIEFGITQAAGGGAYNMYPTPAQSFASSLSSNLGNMSTQILSHQMNLAPTLEIRPGFTFNIVVTKNMLFKKPYQN
jgi:type IV secretory pathway VirB10-like protein